MSNRDRIGRMREEALAAGKEKAAKAEERAKKAASGGTRKPTYAANVRLKVVWGVKDPRGEILATFPYPRRDLAEAEVEKLRGADGRSYIVAPVKVPMEE